jgi:hypothetical protein
METYDIDPSVSQQMFGCDIERFANRIVDSGQYQRCGGLIVVMSMLSDCQEMLGIEGDGGQSKENIRQALNRAKFLLAEMQDGNMIPVVER